MQGRLINELALGGITTAAAANGYLTERFIPDYNAKFSGSPIQGATRNARRRTRNASGNGRAGGKTRPMDHREA